jgi:hypothetical protein
METAPSQFQTGDSRSQNGTRTANHTATRWVDEVNTDQSRKMVDFAIFLKEWSTPAVAPGPTETGASFLLREATQGVIFRCGATNRAGHTVAQETENPAAAAERLMRTLASGKGAAWKEFANALDRYGQGGLDAGGVVRIAGDLYFKEVGRVASLFAGAATDMLGWRMGRGRREADQPPKS